MLCILTPFRLACHLKRPIFSGVSFLAFCAFSTFATKASAGVGLQEYVVKVYGASAPGSGVVIQSNDQFSTVLTANHVVKNTHLEDRPYILTHNGRKYQVVHISNNATLDLAKLTVRGFLQSAPLHRGVHEGGPVTLVGFPQGSTKSVIREGTSLVQGFSPEMRPGGYALIHSAQSGIGFSGGGIFNQLGQLVGIHGQADTNILHSGRVVKTGLALAIPVSFLAPEGLPAGQNAKVVQHADLLARISYLRSTSRIEEAVELISNSLLLRPHDYSLRVLRSSLYLDLKKPLFALEDLTVAEIGMPNSAAVHANKGTAYLASGNYELSLKSYDMAIKLAPKMTAVYINKSKALLKLGKNLEALDVLNKAINNDKKNAHALMERAHLLHDLERYREAERDLKIYIDSYPEDPVALALMGSICGKLKRDQESYDFFARASDLAPNNAAFSLNKAIALASLGKHEESVRLIEEILRKNPRFDSAMANLAEILFTHGRVNDACSAAKKATSLGFAWSRNDWDPLFLKACLVHKKQN